MYKSYLRSIMGGRPFAILHQADNGGSGGSGDGGQDDKGGQGGEGGNGDPTNSPNFDDKLKNDPEFKEWYTKKFGSDFSQRTKKLRDEQGNLIDADEYWKLKAEADKKRQEEETETERLQRELADTKAKFANVEKAEKRVAVKEHAIENGYDPKLVARLMETELDSIKLVEGKYEGIKEAIDGLAEEFPQIKAQAKQEDEGDKGGSGYSAGDKHQRQNPNPPKNAYNKGAERAKARHAQQSK